MSKRDENPTTDEKIALLKQNAEEAKYNAMEALDKVLDRGEPIEKLVEDTQILKDNAIEFGGEVKRFKARNSTSCLTKTGISMFAGGSVTGTGGVIAAVTTGKAAFWLACGGGYAAAIFGAAIVGKKIWNECCGSGYQSIDESNTCCFNC